MKLSELIERLQDNVEFYGDLPVRVRNELTGQFDQSPAVVHSGDSNFIAIT